MIFLIRHYFSLALKTFQSKTFPPTDMARYASEPSPSLMPLVSGCYPLKPLIFYIPHWKSPCFSTCHLEIPYEKSILVWYFHMYKNNQNISIIFMNFCPHHISPCFGIYHLVFPYKKSISIPYFPINTNSNVSFISKIPHFIIRLSLLTKTKRQHARHDLSPFRYCPFKHTASLYISYTDSHNTDYLPKSSIIFILLSIPFSNPIPVHFRPKFWLHFKLVLTPFWHLLTPFLHQNLWYFMTTYNTSNLCKAHKRWGFQALPYNSYGVTWYT